MVPFWMVAAFAFVDLLAAGPNFFAVDGLFAAFLAGLIFVSGSVSVTSVDSSALGCLLLLEVVGIFCENLLSR